MSDKDNILDHLKDVFKDLEGRLNGTSGSPLHNFQKESFEALSRIQFPDRKHEDWRYTPVQKLIAPKYRLSNLSPQVKIDPIPGLRPIVITIINGKADLTEAKSELAFCNAKVDFLVDAWENPSWHKIFMPIIHPADTSSNRAFDLLNFSFQTNAFFIDFPKDVILDRPLEIITVHDDPEVTFSHPLFFIRCGKSSKVDVIERLESNKTQSSSSSSMINSIGYLHLEEGATVSYVRWQNLPEEQNLVYKLFITQERDSRCEIYAFDRGGRMVRNNIEIELEAPNTFSSLQAAYIASGKQSMDHQTRINHKVPHCESHEHYKGILEGQAAGAFNGKVYVHPDAQKTNAYQQNDTLVLSAHAVMNSKPQLEIYADDVKCSHGATIGQIDKKAMFYLKSRGIHEDAATDMLKEAFIAAIIDKIPDDGVKDFIASKMIKA